MRFNKSYNSLPFAYDKLRMIMKKKWIRFNISIPKAKRSVVYDDNLPILAPFPLDLEVRFELGDGGTLKEVILYSHVRYKAGTIFY